MKSESTSPKKLLAEDKKEKLIKSSIAHIEGRIQFLDNKASILMAAMSLCVSATTWGIKEFIWKPPVHYAVVDVSIAAILASWVLLLITVCLLLQTLRPLGWFSVKSSHERHHAGGNIINWFETKWPRRTNGAPFEDYESRVAALTEDDYLANYKRTHCILLERIRAK